MSNFLVLTALGENRSGLVRELTEAIADSRCSIVDCRMTALGRMVGAYVLVTGNWNTLAKLEVQLERWAQGSGVLIHALRTEPNAERDHLMPYAVEVVALDQSGIIHRLAEFFIARQIHIEDLASRTYQATHTGAAMATVNLVVGVPADVHLSMLREAFMDFCDQQNWDAVLEPVKA